MRIQIQRHNTAFSSEAICDVVDESTAERIKSLAEGYKIEQREAGPHMRAWGKALYSRALEVTRPALAAPRSFEGTPGLEAL